MLAGMVVVVVVGFGLRRLGSGDVGGEVADMSFGFGRRWVRLGGSIPRNHQSVERFI